MELQPEAKLSWRLSLRLNALLPKINEDLSDCQDSTGVNLENGRFCLSDGATQSFFPKLWSQELCDSYCNIESVVNHSNWLDWLSQAQRKWRDLVFDRCSSLQIQKKISWIECSNGLALKRPAYATFLGFSIEEDFIKGVSIGDSYAFLVRIYTEKVSSPQRSGVILERIIPGLWRPDFSNRTEGLCSYAEIYDSKPEFFGIPIKCSDDSQLVILIMSDALASYALAAQYRDESILPVLAEMTSSDQFETLVTHLRSIGLANDDTSLLSIQVEPDLSNCSRNNLDQLGHGDLDESRTLMSPLPHPLIHSPEHSSLPSNDLEEATQNLDSDGHSTADIRPLIASELPPSFSRDTDTNSPSNPKVQDDEQRAPSPSLPDFIPRGKDPQLGNPLIDQVKKMLRITNRRMRD